MKDLFSGHAGEYAAFRPVYPEALYAQILPHTQGRGRAWDCGTGNGQIAAALSAYFEEVCASDISQAQMAQAPQLANVTYTLCPAEQSPWPDHYVDLITVGQAVHWFDIKRFYAEVRRVARPGALLVLVGYNYPALPGGAGPLLDRFYHETIYPYWESERHYLDEKYQTIPFDFAEIPVPPLQMEFHWSVERLLRYVGTWSAVKSFIRKNGNDPLVELGEQMQSFWPQEEVREVVFPLYVRMGRV